jgi:phosphohistidine phosphatase
VIWLLRHGEAEEGEGKPDADRELTEKGERQSTAAGKALGKLGVELGGDFDPLEVAAGRGEAMLVGHEPDFSSAIALVTGSRVKMKKGGIAALDDHVLHMLLRPKDLKAIAD